MTTTRLLPRVEREAARLQFIRGWHAQRYAGQHRCQRVYAPAGSYDRDEWAACVLDPGHPAGCRAITVGGDIVHIPDTMLEVP